jgi:hypothetical protein
MFSLFDKVVNPLCGRGRGDLELKANPPQSPFAKGGIKDDVKICKTTY